MPKAQPHIAVGDVAAKPEQLRAHLQSPLLVRPARGGALQGDQLAGVGVLRHGNLVKDASCLLLSLCQALLGLLEASLDVLEIGTFAV